MKCGGCRLLSCRAFAQPRQLCFLLSLSRANAMQGSFSFAGAQDSVFQGSRDRSSFPFHTQLPIHAAMQKCSLVLAFLDT
jgi:hypothetical protein